MSDSVPYLSENAIERDAMRLLSEYEDRLGIKVIPPIPIEAIAEKALDLLLEFDDLEQLFNTPLSAGKLLGAIILSENRIVIDESLDPDVNPRLEGRYRFTVAHEVGHHRLHRHLFVGADSKRPDSIVCKGDPNPRIEWQADYYASCLLMPRAMVKVAWRRAFGSAAPAIFADNKTCRRSKRPGLVPIGEVLAEVFAPEEMFFRQIAKRIAPVFGVSVLAMAIRLQRIGLLLEERPNQDATLLRRAET